ncbi:DNA mismatch repair protein MutS [Candidatus Fermentibacteria bacterium]|nr:DNA mismatch repair protein MutS [Candidatus Fermentibacteria bacterium]
MNRPAENTSATGRRTAGAKTATPMMRQYWSVKRRYPGALVLFRLGDFYETFGEDAALASKVLGIALTSRGGDIPLAGIPFHSADPYIDRLVAAGHKVAICEQLEDPAKAKGIVRRDVVRVVTPGTVLSEGLLNAGAPTYLAAVNPGPSRWGLAIVDIASGEFKATELALNEVGEEIQRVSPAELLVPRWLRDQDALHQVLAVVPHAAVEAREDWVFDGEAGADLLNRHFGTATLEGFGLHSGCAAVGAAGAVIHYLLETQKSGLGHIRSLRVYHLSEFMRLDRHTRRNLELVDSLDPDDRDVTLLAALNRTCSRMGERLLRRWILEPLLDIDAIEERLDAVQALVDDDLGRSEVRGLLSSMADIERLTGRIGCRAASARDLVSLASSLEHLPRLAEQLSKSTSSFLGQTAMKLRGEQEIVEEIHRVLVDRPPPHLRAGGYVRTGCDTALDELRAAARDGKTWLSELQQRERDDTGIPSLRVGFNRVFGFYIEVTKPHLPRVPERYLRKQTLANAERFYTAELKEKESLILGAEERALERERELFDALLIWLEIRLTALLTMASAVATGDVIQSLAQLARERSYRRPDIDSSARISLSSSRHPVVEQLGTEPFMPNDVLLDNQDHQLVLLTGPNMAGKSTYLRQVGLIVLMAQIGSFVPAEAAEIGVVDQIFTRVGATDRLARGQSTFMVEMIETASILHHATDRSLVLLDEIGRGTSTYDGLAIAWSVAERLHQGPMTPRTIFATHYHELTALEADFPRIVNYNVAVRREGDRVLFLHRIQRGAASSSYGIEVARLAGLPADVLLRAAEILAQLEDHPPAARTPTIRRAVSDQLELFGAPEDPLKSRLQGLVVDQITPLQALHLLHELKRLARDK